MENVLEQFKDYARQWVGNNVTKPKDKERISEGINSISSKVYMYLDGQNLDLISDFVRCAFVLVSCWGCWDGIATLKAFFPANPSRIHPREAYFSGFPRKILAPPQTRRLPSEYEEKKKNLCFFLSLLSGLPSHYKDIVVTPEKKKNDLGRLDPDKGGSEDYFIERIFKNKYGKKFLPLWLIWRRGVFERSGKTDNYIASLRGIEHFIYTYLETGGSGDSDESWAKRLVEKKGDASGISSIYPALYYMCVESDEAVPH